MVTSGSDDASGPERYAGLAQRIGTWLTSTTGAGHLYDTDLRLRPDGAAGLMVSSLPSFRKYQRTQAWTWEHQALTRARFCAGDRAVGDAFEAIRFEVLTRPRDAAALAIEVLAASQALDLLAPLSTSTALQRAHNAVRAVVPTLTVDRTPAPDIQAIGALISDGALERACSLQLS